MKPLNSPPIEPVLTVIGTEIGAAYQLLLGFEHAVNHADFKRSDLIAELQGFDLALQILNDVKHLSELLGQQLPPEIALPHPLPTAGIKLERVRAKLTQQPNQLSASHSHDTDQAVDLF